MISKKLLLIPIHPVPQRPRNFKRDDPPGGESEVFSGFGISAFSFVFIVYTEFPEIFYHYIISGCETAFYQLQERFKNSFGSVFGKTAVIVYASYDACLCDGHGGDLHYGIVIDMMK